jgi:NAD+ dependent glucose-6-phosphate dehydrogenase
MKILITGANGRIGRILREALTEHDLRLLSRSPMEDSDAESFVGDIADFDSIRPAFEGVDAVLHLAAASDVGAGWEPVLNANVVGARNVYEAALAAGVERVVYASTTHNVAGHERAAGPGIYDLDQSLRFGADVEPRPDSLYGASKVFGEALGRWYSDVHGLRVICLRIGYVSGRPDEEIASAEIDAAVLDELDPDKRTARRRVRAIWLSQRDCIGLFRAALAADVRWAVVYGTSNNPRQIWDLEPTRRLLSFEPQDGAPV